METVARKRFASGTSTDLRVELLLLFYTNLLFENAYQYILLLLIIVVNQRFTS